MNTRCWLLSDISLALSAPGKLREFYNAISRDVPGMTADRWVRYDGNPDHLLSDIGQMIIRVSHVYRWLRAAGLHRIANQLATEVGLTHLIVNEPESQIRDAAVNWARVRSMLEDGLTPPAWNTLAIWPGSVKPLDKLEREGIHGPDKKTALSLVRNLMLVLDLYKSTPWFRAIVQYESFLASCPDSVPVTAPLTSPTLSVSAATAKPTGRVRGMAKLRTVEPMSPYLVIASGDAEDSNAGLHAVTNEPILAEDTGKKYVVQESREPYYRGMELGVYHLVSESKVAEAEVKLHTHAKVLDERPATETENKRTTVQLTGEERDSSKSSNPSGARTISVSIGGKRRVLTTGPQLPEFLVVARGSVIDSSAKAIYEPVIQSPAPDTFEEHCDLADLMASQDRDTSYGVYLLLVSNKRDIPDTVRSIHANVQANARAKTVATEKP